MGTGIVKNRCQMKVLNFMVQLVKIHLLYFRNFKLREAAFVEFLDFFHKGYVSSHFV